MVRTPYPAPNRQTKRQVTALDSGASVHLMNASALDGCAVLHKEEAVIRTAQAGSEMKSTFTTNVGVMERVRIVENDALDTNLASVAMFDAAGYRCVFEGGTGTVYDGDGSVIIRANLVDGLYLFDAKDTPVVAHAMLASTAPKEDIHLWHRRLGHRNTRAILTAVNKNLVCGISKSAIAKPKPTSLCDSCAKSKSTRIAFHQNRHEPVRKEILVPVNMNLACVSTDIKGPLGIAGPNREVYYQSYIDNSTKWVCVYLMEYRSQAFDNLKDFVEVKLAAESMHMSEYRSDGAPELISRDLVLYLNKRGTRVSWSPPYTPELNGIVERSHQTIFNMGHAMLLESVVPMQFWTFAIQHAAYLFNRLPTTTAEGYMSPYQARYGKVPGVGHLHIWGCVCYAHIPEELRSKGFADKAYRCYFLGIHEPSDSSWVYYIDLDRVGKTVHVIFDEVTHLKRETTHVLTVQEERKVVGDFEYLIGMLFRDDEDGLLYVTQRVVTERGFIVAYVARVSVDGSIGSIMNRPIHVPEVARMVVEYQQKETPRVHTVEGWQRIAVCDVTGGKQVPRLDGTAGVTGLSTGDNQLSSKGPGSGRCETVVMPGKGVLPESRGGVGHPASSEPGHRLRKRRKPLNVDVLGDVSGADAYAKLMRLDHYTNHDLVSQVTSISNTDATVEISSTSDEEYFLESRYDEIVMQYMDHRCWDIVPRPDKTQQVIPCRWVDTLKNKHDESTKKSRLVARGDRDVHKNEYHEVYAPVARMVTLRIFLSLVATLKMYTVQMDVRTAFLYAPIKEEIYLKPPADLMRLLVKLYRLVDDKSRTRLRADIQRLQIGGVMKLRKSLYGLKQSPKNWHRTISRFLLGIGFTATKSDSCLYYIVEKEELVLLLLYVDDILLAATSQPLLHKYSQHIRDQYRVRMKPTLDQYLRIELVHHREQRLITMSLSQYIRDACANFGIKENTAITSPMMPSNILRPSKMTPQSPAEHRYVANFPLKEMLGVLNYVAITCRPDIQYAVSYLARFAADPTNLVCRAVYRVMQYLLNTHDLQLHLGGDVPKLSAMCDSDFGGDAVGSKSTSGHIIFMGRGPVVWHSKKQTIVAQSTAEAEYIALTPTCQNILGIRLLLLEIPYAIIHQYCATTIWDDNAAAITWSENPIVNTRTKHIPIKYHYVRELVADYIVKCAKIDSHNNGSDLMTKAVTIATFMWLCPVVMGQRSLPEIIEMFRTNMESEYLKLKV